MEARIARAWPVQHCVCLADQIGERSALHNGWNLTDFGVERPRDIAAREEPVLSHLVQWRRGYPGIVECHLVCLFQIEFGRTESGTPKKPASNGSQGPYCNSRDQ